MSLIGQQLRAMREKWNNWGKILKHNGGLKATVVDVFRRDAYKYGKLVGTDRHGNKYYENNDYFYLRNRWVAHSDKYGFDYDASHIPPEWHRWMHHGTDLPPSTHPRPRERWEVLDNIENMTGSIDRYVPYSTTENKIEPWNPSTRPAKRAGSRCD